MPKDSPQRVFTTISGVPVERVYTSDNLADLDNGRDLGEPGEAPYTRGIAGDMYREQPWTMQPFEITFDTRTLQGLDADDPAAGAEAAGASIHSLADMELLLQDLPLATTPVFLMANATGPVLWAMYLAAAEKRGIAWDSLHGILQNDVLGDAIAGKPTLLPLDQSVRLAAEVITFSSRHVPQWNPIAVGGYSVREAGSTALQEAAFALYDGIEYVKAVVQAGLDVDDFAPHILFYFDAHNDLFEEIAKYRAARNVWQQIMRERFHCRKPESAMLRIHARTSEAALSDEQPENNIARVAIQALAAVLGGTQSLHTGALDTTIGRPSERAEQIAVRTQQVLAHESGITRTADPFGGSYFLERLTLDMEKGVRDYFQRLDAMGGMAAAIRQGFPQKEVENAREAYRSAVEKKERTVVGVNDFIVAGPTPANRTTPSTNRAAQIENLKRLRATRDNPRTRAALDALDAASQTGENRLPPILDCVRAGATIGEICSELQKS